MGRRRKKTWLCTLRHWVVGHHWRGLPTHTFPPHLMLPAHGVPHPFRRRPVQDGVQYGRESAMEQTQPVPFAQPEKQVLERSQLEVFRSEQTFYPFLYPRGKQSSRHRLTASGSQTPSTGGQSLTEARKADNSLNIHPGLYSHQPKIFL